MGPGWRLRSGGQDVWEIRPAKAGTRLPCAPATCGKSVSRPEWMCLGWFPRGGGTQSDRLWVLSTKALE